MTEQGQDLIPGLSASDHVRGSLDAPVVITEFGDFDVTVLAGSYTALRRTTGEIWGPHCARV